MSMYTLFHNIAQPTPEQMERAIEGKDGYTRQTVWVIEYLTQYLQQTNVKFSPGTPDSSTS